MSIETAILQLNILKVSFSEWKLKEQLRLNEEVVFLSTIETSPSSLIDETTASTSAVVTTDINKLLEL
ncbi:hypothetical protein LCGC14_0147580 [marine sediment metagenome]|uniref:Uncharacterized protein n=1 Tax=marine sediment metagenome TaxID=412755 RepID=A0A0F9XHQ8_9ZZZZ